MQLRVLEKDKTKIRIEIIEPDTTIINPLLEELLKDPKVESAIYKQAHPKLDLPILEVSVKSGKPEAVVKKAAKGLSQMYKDLQDVMGAKMDKMKKK